jgi:transcriptional regulator GlxA family with amidase domain
MDALPERLSVREMAAGSGVSLRALQKAFERAHCTTPVANVQHRCLQAARAVIHHFHARLSRRLMDTRVEREAALRALARV